MTDEVKKSIKNSLLFISVTLGLISIILIIYAMTSTLKDNISLAEKRGHYIKFFVKDETGSMQSKLDDELYEIEKEASSSFSKSDDIQNYVGDGNKYNDFDEKNIEKLISDKVSGDKIDVKVDGVQDITTHKNKHATQIISHKVASTKIKKPKKSKIALFISNLGNNPDLTKKAIELHKNVTLGFLPYSQESNKEFLDSIKNGFEAFIYIPFEPKGYPENDPGPNPILAKNGSYINMKNIRELTKNYNGYTGIYGCFRENISHKKDVFEPIVKYMKEKNKLLLLGKTYPGTKPQYMRNYKNMINSNMIIDLIPDKDIIRQNLDQLIKIAKNSEFTIGFVNTYPITLEILKEYIPIIEQSDLEIVTISNIIVNR